MNIPIFPRRPLFSIESTTRGKELALILSKYEGEDGAEEVTPPSSVSRPPRRRSCRASSATAENEWQEEESQTAKSEEKNEEKDIGQERGVASGSEGESKLQIVFRFGMSGKFDYKLCEGDLHKHAHLNFHAR